MCERSRVTLKAGQKTKRSASDGSVSLGSRWRLLSPPTDDKHSWQIGAEPQGETLLWAFRCHWRRKANTLAADRLITGSAHVRGKCVRLWELIYQMPRRETSLAALSAADKEFCVLELQVRDEPCLCVSFMSVSSARLYTVHTRNIQSH